jgi:hypothetical protein
MVSRAGNAEHRSKRRVGVPSIRTASRSEPCRDHRSPDGWRLASAKCLLQLPHVKQLMIGGGQQHGTK